MTKKSVIFTHYELLINSIFILILKHLIIIKSYYIRKRSNPIDDTIDFGIASLFLFTKYYKIKQILIICLILQQMIELAICNFIVTSYNSSLHLPSSSFLPSDLCCPSCLSCQIIYPYPKIQYLWVL